MVSKNLLKENSARMNPDDIPRTPDRYQKPKAEPADGSSDSKVPSVKGVSLPEEVADDDTTNSGVLEDVPGSKGAVASWRRCHLRGNSKLKKIRRDERCKYCRRLLSHSSAVWLGKGVKGGSQMTPPSLSPRPSSSRRLLDSPMDEVAWACGRLWCSVRRRKRRKISSHFQRKQINEAFSTLREILPHSSQMEEVDSAAAKVSTLRLAASYIQALSDLLRDTHLTEGSSSGDKKGHKDDSASEDEQRDKSVLRRQADTSQKDFRSLDSSVSQPRDCPPNSSDVGGKRCNISHLKANKSHGVCKENLPKYGQEGVNHNDFFRSNYSRRFQIV